MLRGIGEINIPVKHLVKGDRLRLTRRYYVLVDKGKRVSCPCHC
jgi:hypothetical protein